MKNRKSALPLNKVNLIFAAMVSLTVASSGAAIYLVSQPVLSERQNRILETTMLVWTMGTTALVTLISVHPEILGRKDDYQD